jgi:hypothetical protein
VRSLLSAPLADLAIDHCLLPLTSRPVRRRSDTVSQCCQAGSESNPRSDPAGPPVIRQDNVTMRPGYRREAGVASGAAIAAVGVLWLRVFGGAALTVASHRLDLVSGG